MKRISFVRSAAVLAIAGLAAKIIGAVFRIPLLNIINIDGMAYFQVAYPVYAFMAVVATAGVPTAISRMVAQRAAQVDYAGAKSVFKHCMMLMLMVSALAAAAIALLSTPIAKLTGLQNANLALLAVAPVVLLSSALAAVRGYFQGLQMMAPTAISQLTEQLIKLLLGLALAKQLLPQGADHAAMGAVLGVAAGELIALLLMVVFFLRNRQRFAEFEKIQSVKPAKPKDIRREFLRLSVPITVGSAILPLCGVIDALIIVRRMEAVGYTAEQARNAFGILQGSVNPLLALPVVVALALSMSLVPAIVAYVSRKEYALARAAASAGTKLSVLLGMPAAVGMAVLSKPILVLLYGTSLTEANLSLAADLLSVGAAAVFFLALAQTSAGILQGLHREKVPAFNLIIAIFIKAVGAFVLIGLPDVNIQGAMVSSLCAFAALAILNTAHMTRRAGIHLSALDFFVKPAFASACMGAAVYFVYYGLVKGMFGGLVDLLLGILMGLMVFVALILLLRTVSREEYAFLPGGEKALDELTRAGVYK